ncbi:MAG: hypothetical protein E7665_02090 [Ruminococcaceae bacterium]|nr:hypothetical protein [Oscillospiraceae bacterium]
MKKDNKKIKKNNDSLSIGSVFTGLVFLMNPCINIIDILPDFIGCIIIFRALLKLSLVDSRIETARKSIQIFGWVSAVKFALTFAMPFLHETPAQRDSNVLLATFIFAAAEGFLMLSFVNGFYGGLGYLANRYAGDRIISEASPSRIYMTLFFIIKNILVMVPEAFTIFHPDVVNEFEADHFSNLKQFTFMKNVAVLTCFVIMTVYFFYTIFYAKKFFSLCDSNRAFNEDVNALYLRDYHNDEKLWIKMRGKSILTLLKFSVFFLTDLYIDKINFIPTFIFFIFAVFIFVYLKKIVPGKLVNAFIFISVLSIFASAGAYAYRLYNVYSLSFGFSYAFKVQPFAMMFALLEQGLAVACITGIMLVLSKLYDEKVDIDIRPEKLTMICGAFMLGLLNIMNYAHPEMGAIYSFAGIAFGFVYLILTMKATGDLKDELMLY